MRTADSGIEKEDIKLYEAYWAKQFDKLEEGGAKAGSGKDNRAASAYEHITDNHIERLRKEHRIY